ncbi:MAG: hypothetical protein AAF206_03400 [Bacteroidota bacterium]
MKRLNLFLSFVLIISLIACDRNNLEPGPQIEPPLVALQYDGPNQTAPSLAGGTYEGSVRFRSNQLANIVDGKLTDVYFYIMEKPQSVSVKIYEGSENTGPRDLVYSAGVTSAVTGNSWNQHTLSNPLNISGEDLWIAVKFSHTNQAQTLGCDPGPNQPNGDWLLDESDNQWLTFGNRAAGASINWNIRAAVDVD